MAELISNLKKSPTADVDVGSTEVDSGDTALAVMEQSRKTALTTEQRARAEALADQALAGDLDALKTFEAEVPHARQYLIEVFGDLARDTRRQIIESYFSPEDAVRKRGINLASDQLRLALSRDEGDPLERLLIERIACNWIEVHLVEQLTNQMRADDKVELSQVEYYQKFLDRTQKRFLNGCKALAQVRKLIGVESNKNKGKASSRAPLETGNDE